MARTSVEVTTTELRHLELDLRRAPNRLQRKAPATLKKASVKIKRGMKREFFSARGVRGHKGYYPHIAAAVDFDEITPWHYEIGVNKDTAGKQAGLGNILAFGTSNNAPVVDYTAPLRREVPVLLHHLANDAEESIFESELMRRYPPGKTP